MFPSAVSVKKRGGGLFKSTLRYTSLPPCDSLAKAAVRKHLNADTEQEPGPPSKQTKVDPWIDGGRARI